MKQIIFFASILFLFGCEAKKNENLIFDVYSVVVDNSFSKSSTTSDSIFIVLNDSISDFKNELGELIYSVENNSSFFDEYFHGDTSFKSFILGIKRVDSRVLPMKPDKIKSTRNFIITTTKKFHAASELYSTLYLSNVVFNEQLDKAIMFVSGNSSGSWVFLSFKKHVWIFENRITLWLV